MRPFAHESPLAIKNRTSTVFLTLPYPSFSSLGKEEGGDLPIVRADLLIPTINVVPCCCRK